VSRDSLQLPLAIGIELPFRPEELAKLTTPERGRVYAAADLDAMQIDAAEAAVRAVIAKTYAKTYGRGRRA
jgi:hypothetical protein